MNLPQEVAQVLSTLIMLGWVYGLIYFPPFDETPAPPEKWRRVSETAWELNQDV
jgi:hypothetical protein